MRRRIDHLQVLWNLDKRPRKDKGISKNEMKFFIVLGNDAYKMKGY